MTISRLSPPARPPQGPPASFLAVGLIAIALLAAAITPARAATPGGERPLAVRAQITRGPHFVGQSLTLQVSVVAAGERPGVPIPKVAGADVLPAGTDLKPISTSGIGLSVTEQNIFLSRFRIIPRRSGVVVVPSITAKLGERSGTTQPLRLNVRDVPLSGRTGAFLGGVGPFDVAAEVSAPSVRRGQEFEYRLVVTGPAARSSTRRPELAIRAGQAGPVKVEPLPAEVVAEPPSCVFRYRVRPEGAGTLVLPPLAVAAFDPQLERYLTKLTPSVSVQVRPIAQLDPATLDYRPPTPAEPVWPWVVGAAIGSGVAAAVTALAWPSLQRRRSRRRAERAVRRLLARLIRGPGAGTSEPTEMGRWIAEGLAEYLQATQGRPLGALTPGEASDAIARVEHDDLLARSAARLVERCDRARFSGDGPSSDEIVAEARALWNALDRGGSRPWRIAGLRKNRERQS